MLELESHDKEIIDSILAPYIAEESLWVFGSRVTGSARSNSDLDLVIRGKGQLPLSEWQRLADDIEYSEMNTRVDLVDWHRLSDEFKNNIAGQMVLWPSE